MSTTPVRGFGAMLVALADQETQVAAPPSRAAELRALDVGLDTAGAAQTDLVASFFPKKESVTAAGERVRLPPPPGAGRELSAAGARILGVDTSAASSSREQVAKEARMRRVLEALIGVVDFVQVRATQERSY